MVPTRINKTAALSISGGRHPVVEQVVGAGGFIANDSDLAEDVERFAIITGPNMAGKSTYIRQVAVLLILAQMGRLFRPMPRQLAWLTACFRVLVLVMNWLGIYRLWSKWRSRQHSQSLH